MDTDIEPRLKRLTNLIGADEGFYILALHSFIEFYLRKIKNFGNEMTFPQLTWAFREELLGKHEDSFISGLGSLGQLGRQHALTNRVRHDFEQIDEEEAKAATHLFIRFCKLAGIGAGEQLNLFYRHLEVWKNHDNYLQQNIVIRTLKKELSELKKKNKSLLFQLDGYQDLKDEIRELQLSIETRDIEITRLQNQRGTKDSRLDELRQERFILHEEKNRLLREKENYIELEKYLSHLGRMTVYTRSRLDYERLLSQLTPEQEAAAAAVRLDRDFLIKGSAGTGKSLVLIEIMRRALMQRDLDLTGDQPLVFITFTKTLVKYNKFISELMSISVPLDIFSTVDTLIFSRLKDFEPEMLYDFTCFKKFCAGISVPGFIDAETLGNEVEDFLIGRAVSEEEYLKEGPGGSSGGTGFSPEQKRKIWKILEGFISFMEESRVYSINYGRLKLFRHLTESRTPGKVRHIFIDEVQDLNPAALLCLKALASGHLIMAGDFDQALYMTGEPFSRAGISIRGAVRVLKTNFRNTRQILDAAEKFRSTRPGGKSAESAAAFRDGPEPEIYTEDDEAVLRDILIRRTLFFIEELGYDPENICILTPRNSYIDLISTNLEERGVTAFKINEDDFEFTSRGRIGISTLHSCKGLDFPVVLLYLPELRRLEKYSPDQAEELLRNLVYVGMTRAMDHLNLFVLDTGDKMVGDKILNDIIRVFSDSSP